MNEPEPEDPLKVGPDGLTVDGLTVWEAQCMMLDIARLSVPKGTRLRMKELAALMGVSHQCVDLTMRDGFKTIRDARAGIPRKRNKRRVSGKVLPDEAFKKPDLEEAA